MTFHRLTIALCLGALSLEAGPLDNAWLMGRTDRNPLSYRQGERIVFTLTPQDVDGEIPPETYYLYWIRTGDDGKRESGKVSLSAQPFVYETSIDQPGFVRLEAYVVDGRGTHYRRKFVGSPMTPEGRAAMNRFERQNKEVFFDGGAGADVETLRSEQEPKDFDSFWERQFARLGRVPVKADQVEVDSPNPRTRLYAVRVDCAGLRPVTGYLSVPKAIGDGLKFPARLETQGYSGSRCVHEKPTATRDDEIVLNINPHGLKLVEFGATEADTKALRWEIRSHDRNYAFDPLQNEDPETAYFNGMLLRVKRALQYLKTIGGWNGRNLLASGNSQGGLQSVWAAACGEGVTRIECGIPWCCDLYTSGKLRRDASLKLAADSFYIPWVEALGYYDAAHFAKRIPRSCRVVVTRAGLGDYTCPPAGIVKFWNNISGNKEIHWVQGSEHGYVPPRTYPGRDHVIRME